MDKFFLQQIKHNIYHRKFYIFAIFCIGLCAVQWSPFKTTPKILSSQTHSYDTVGIPSQKAEVQGNGIATKAINLTITIKDPEVKRLLKTLKKKDMQHSLFLQQKGAFIEEFRELRKQIKEDRAQGIVHIISEAQADSSSSQAKVALKALKNGDAKLSVEFIRKQEEQAVIEGNKMLTKAARLARDQGALAIGYNVEAAVAAYWRSAKYEPEHDDALKSFNQSLRIHQILATQDRSVFNDKIDKGFIYQSNSHSLSMEFTWYYFFIGRCMLLGIILMMFVYHLIIWFDRKNDKSNIFILFFLAITFLLTASDLIGLFCNFISPDLKIIIKKYVYFDGANRVGIFIEQWIAPFSVLFLNSFFQTDRRNGIILSFIYAGTMSLYMLISPWWFIDRTFDYSIILTIPLLFYILYLIISAYIDHKQYSGYVLLASVVLSTAVLYDILLGLPLGKFLPIPYAIFPLSLVAVAISLSILLSKKYSAAFKRVEYLSKNLALEVEYQTEQLSLQKKELEQKNTQLIEADKYKTNFFQNITHEFRTPLTLILSPIDKIIKSKHPLLPSQLQGDAFKIKHNASQMLDMVNQVLAFSKLDAGKMHLDLERFNIISHCTSIYRSFESLAEEKSIAYTTDFPDNIPPIYSDKFKINRIITNILSNAFKFTANGGTIGMDITFPLVSECSTETHNEMVRIRIHDTGIGISEQELPHIFERFRQGDGSINRKFGGTGIGLALAKEFTTLLNGELNVQSIYGEGTEFTVLLPIEFHTENEGDDITSNNKIKQLTNDLVTHSKPDTTPGTVNCIIINTDKTAISEPYKDSIFDPNKKTVFIVEDNEEMLSFLKSNLESMYNIFAGFNGKHGLDKIKKLPTTPNLIISDIMMPEMDGLEFYKNLTSNSDFLHIPFIFLSAIRDERLKGLSLGAVDFIEKPFVIDELSHKIESLIQLQSNHGKKITKKIGEQIAIIFNQDQDISGIEALFNERCRNFLISDREKDVIRLIQRGCSDKMIADELCISKYTVNAHLKNIYNKCGSNSRIELIKRFSPNQ